MENTNKVNEPNYLVFESKAYKEKLRTGKLIDLEHIYFEISSYGEIIEVKLDSVEYHDISIGVTTVSTELDWEGYEPEHEGGGVIGETIFHTKEEALLYVQLHLEDFDYTDYMKSLSDKETSNVL